MTIDQHRITRLNYINTPLFGELQGKVTNTVLRMLNHELELLRRPDFPTECTCKTLKTMGFPCGHTLQRRCAASEPVLLSELHRRWLLEPELQSLQRAPFQNVREPLVLRRSRRQATLHRDSPDREAAPSRADAGIDVESHNDSTDLDSTSARRAQPGPSSNDFPPHPTAKRLSALSGTTRKRKRGKGKNYLLMS